MILCWNLKVLQGIAQLKTVEFLTYEHLSKFNETVLNQFFWLIGIIDSLESICMCDCTKFASVSMWQQIGNDIEIKSYLFS